MSDAELIESLRLWNRDDAADRIEALIAERDEANKRGDAWRFRADIAEVKLAKAVELLTLCRDMFGEVASPSDPLSVMLNETLAEIKGESHE